MFSKFPIIKTLFISAIIILASCGKKATATEPDMEISYVQNNVTHAVILCKASKDLCVLNPDATVSKELFVKAKGYAVLKNTSTIILNDELYFVLTVSSK